MAVSAACLLWVALLALALAPVPVQARLPEAPRMRLIGVADGLPSSNVNAMAQDRAGYLWIATTDGLARYDGVGMRVWQHVPGDPQALPGNYIAALHVDARDRVWVAIEGRGVSVLDASRTAFRHYRKADSAQIGSDDTWAIASQGDVVWFGTYGGGLHRLDRAGRIRRFMPDPADPHSLPSDTVLALSVDRAGVLWVGTTQGLARWNGRDFDRVALPGAQPHPTVISIRPEGDGLWVGARTGLHLRAASGRWTRPAWAGAFAWPNGVFDVVRDHGGYWVASHRNLWRVLPGQAPRPVAIGEHGPVRPVYQILRQPDGGLWFPVAGTGLGYLRADWPQLTQLTRDRDGLGDDLYPGVVADARGIWLAGNGGQIERIDRRGGMVPLPLALRAVVRGRRLVSIATDRAGRLWLGERAALLRVDADGGVREWAADGAADAIPGGSIDLLRLAPDGSLWLSSAGAGLQQRDPDTGRVVARVLPGPAQGLGVGDLEALAFDAGGALWVAGADGLSRYDRRGNRLDPVPGIPGGDRVFAFDFDGADTLWLQRLSGLERYRRHGLRWVRIDRVGAAEGIPAVEGSGLRVDAHHRVWLSTLRGLLRWDPRQRRLRRYGLADGLSSHEFLDRTIALSDDGVLAATLADGGVVLVDTTAAELPARRPVLRWDRLEVRRDGGWQALDLTRPALRAQDSELRVQLRLLDFGDPGGNRYSTRLEGFDRHWIAQGNSGERVLAGLPPGHYVLRARAVDAAGNAAAEQVLRFDMPPPWWRTPAALLASAVLALLLIGWMATAARQRARRRAALELARRQREAADEASLAKTRFLATLGHEVRTPMTGVLGMSELLLGTALDPQQRSYTQALRAAGEHLLRLVNDALDLARIESGRLELADEPFALREMLDGVVALMGPLARQRGLALRTDIAGGLPAGVVGDGNRVRQILLNLIGNAIKFTERGHVSLRVAVHGDGLRFEVGDTGPGLSAEHKARLFQRFEQAEGARTSARYGGSGLGLAISQELAAAMSGRIDVDSTPGVGSHFTLWLPLRSAALPVTVARPASSPRRWQPLALLLVEDEPVVAEVVAGLLRAQGHRVTHVAHALAALTELATARFDVALLDLDLPGLDGVALARQLRAGGLALPLVAITARADAQAQPEAMAAGFDRFIRKPVTHAMLAELLESCTIASAPAPAEAAVAAEPG